MIFPKKIRFELNEGIHNWILFMSVDDFPGIRIAKWNAEPAPEKVARTIEAVRVAIIVYHNSIQGNRTLINCDIAEEWKET